MTKIEDIATDIRNEYAAKKVLALLEKMAADHDYMSAVGKEGRRRVRSLLKIVRKARGKC